MRFSVFAGEEHRPHVALHHELAAVLDGFPELVYRPYGSAVVRTEHLEIVEGVCMKKVNC